jgi:hypothetical protein
VAAENCFMTALEFGILSLEVNDTFSTMGDLIENRHIDHAVEMYSVVMQT